jgi:uncharacterized lipoprotein YajG|tara:strand:+ start:57 stop:407 length:351 start_codon:yes stop_codon:yes gene_type:complete
MEKVMPMFLLMLAACMLYGCSTSHETQDTHFAISQPQTAARLAQATVAALLSIPDDEVTIVSSEAMSFRDSSLDCPQENTMYAQVITSGYRVVAQASGQSFDVRVSGNHAAICNTP